MLGLMQDWPLVIHKIIDYAAGQHGGREVVTRSVEGPVVRTDYRSIRARALQVAQRLERAGIAPGDRIATLASLGASDSSKGTKVASSSTRRSSAWLTIQAICSGKRRGLTVW